MEKHQNQLIFATNNVHKAAEIGLMVSDFDVVTMRDAGIIEDIPETADTLEGNALIKARHIYQMTGADCFADDTGLEVNALAGRPGVLSARYAGPENDAEKNMAKLLSEMHGQTNRSARFRTVIALILGGKEYLFEGIAEGTILIEKSGEGGFGYDPIFYSTEAGKSFASMLPAEKNVISHRGKAVASLILFLNQSA